MCVEPGGVTVRDAVAALVPHHAQRREPEPRTRHERPGGDRCGGSERTPGQTIDAPRWHCRPEIDGDVPGQGGRLFGNRARCGPRNGQCSRQQRRHQCQPDDRRAEPTLHDLWERLQRSSMLPQTSRTAVPDRTVACGGPRRKRYKSVRAGGRRRLPVGAAVLVALTACRPGTPVAARDARRRPTTSEPATTGSTTTPAPPTGGTSSASPAGSRRRPRPGPPCTGHSISPIGPAQAARMGTSWHPGCPVPLSGLRVLTLSYWGFDDAASHGTADRCRRSGRARWCRCSGGCSTGGSPST